MTAKGGESQIAEIVCLLTIASMAVYWDIKNWRIPNWLIGFGMISGFTWGAVQSGFRTGLLKSLLGVIVPIVILYFLFLIKALGAGDIKLFAVVGSYIGTPVITIIFYSFLAGGVISLIYLLMGIILSVTYRKNLSGETGRNAGLMKHRIHFSLAIMAGVLMYVLV
jgi:prepilin peptidase CpaA